MLRMKWQRRYQLLLLFQFDVAIDMLYKCNCRLYCVVSLQIVIRLMCELTPFQRKLYQGLRQRISLEDLLRSSSNLSHAPTSHLMNLVMQFRKVWLFLLHLIGQSMNDHVILPQVCNHPDLFERREVKFPVLVMATPPIVLPKLVFHHGGCVLCDHVINI